MFWYKPFKKIYFQGLQVIAQFVSCRMHFLIVGWILPCAVSPSYMRKIRTQKIGSQITNLNIKIPIVFRNQRICLNKKSNCIFLHFMLNRLYMKLQIIRTHLAKATWSTQKCLKLLQAALVIRGGYVPRKCLEYQNRKY